MTTAASDLVVELRGLTKRFRKVAAVDALDLSVPAGARVGLLGPNGAGKTTTPVEIAAHFGTDDLEGAFLEVAGMARQDEEKALA
jgi:ABC-type branched-subunit amino acid transport system ATPase component